MADTPSADAPKPRPHATSAAVGDVLQIDPAYDDVFGGCYLTVTEPKSWGVQGYVAIPGQGIAYYRAPWAALVTIGSAEWIQARDVGDATSAAGGAGG